MQDVQTENKENWLIIPGLVTQIVFVYLTSCDVLSQVFIFLRVSPPLCRMSSMIKTSQMQCVFLPLQFITIVLIKLRYYTNTSVRHLVEILIINIEMLFYMKSMKSGQYDQTNIKLSQFFKSCSEQMCKHPVSSFSDSCCPEPYNCVLMVTTSND